MLLDETELMYVSVQGVSNARGAFDKLESKLPDLKGRKFYGYLKGRKFYGYLKGRKFYGYLKGRKFYGYLKGRKFYGYFNPDTDEYRACVATAAEDPRPETIGLQQWTIPKGLYTYEKIEDWNSKKHLIAPAFERMIRENSGVIDWSRPILEFYKSMNELRLLVPVKA